MAPLPRTFTYRGHDALLRPPEPVQGDREGLVVPSLDVHAAGGWLSARTAPELLASRTIELVFHLASRAELAAVRAFLDAREGRRRGFWLPSFTADAEVTAASASTVTWRTWGYPALLALDVSAHAHWIAYGPGAAAYRWWRMASAVDNGDGTETATVADSGGTASGTGMTSAKGNRYSRLYWARLASDTVEIEYLGPRASRVVVPVVTIPRGTP